MRPPGAFSLWLSGHVRKFNNVNTTLKVGTVRPYDKKTSSLSWSEQGDPVLSPAISVLFWKVLLNLWS